MKLLGCCGPVYLGRDDEAGLDAVIRPVREEVGRRPFERMAEITARLDHRCVRFLGFEREDDVVYAAIEYVERRTLKEAIRSGVSIGWALGILAQVLDTLFHASAMGIRHGDITPSNILVENHGAAKIFGFGNATSEGGTGASADPAMYMGTPDYMAPEVILGKPFSARGDIFSVGCVLFEVVCGRPPFRAHAEDTLVEVLSRALHEEPDYDLVPSGSRWRALRRVIERALEKDPDDRYGDAAAMRADLDVAVNDLGSSRDRVCPRPPEEPARRRGGP